MGLYRRGSGGFEPRGIFEGFSASGPIASNHMYAEVASSDCTEYLYQYAPKKTAADCEPVGLWGLLLLSKKSGGRRSCGVGADGIDPADVSCGKRGTAYAELAGRRYELL